MLIRCCGQLFIPKGFDTAQGKILPIKIESIAYFYNTGGTDICKFDGLYKI